MSKETKIKLCKDCFYYTDCDGFDHHCCHEKSIFKTNLINGRNDYNKASHMRSNSEKCGEEAKLFEKRSLWQKTSKYKEKEK